MNPLAAMQHYLMSSTYIDWETPDVLAKAQELAAGLSDD